jgi:GH25 family lysozyme M1 (1,4-beta-N-acetylmuramidase)
MRGRVAFLVVAICTALAWPSAAAAAPPPRLPGIDVSRFQETIDWPLVGGSDVQFAFVQASRGSGDDCAVKPRRCGSDGFYDSNYAEAKLAGIRVGPYHRAFVGGNGRAGVKADARAEAHVFLTEVGDLAPGDLRPALDMETPFADLSPVELRVWARTWLQRVKRALGVRPIIYTNVTSWAALGNPLSFARAGHPLWVANWNVSAPAVPAANWAGESWRIWQHSSHGHVPGITGRVDLDWLRGGWRSVTVGGGSGGGGVTPAL